MDTGGLAQMTYNNNYSNGFNAPSSGFASRGKGGNPKRLSVALPPNVSSINEDKVDSPLPRATSRSHLLAGLRTAPRSGNQPASAPCSQSYHQLPSPSNERWESAGYNNYTQQQMPQTSMGLGMNQASNGQYAYGMQEQVLAPPSIYGQEEDIDPTVLQQLENTRLLLAHRQRALQQQLDSITAAATQMQGMNMYQLQNQGFYQHQQMQAPVEVPGNPGLYIVFDPASGQYQYVALPQQQQIQQIQRRQSPMAQSQSMYNLSASPTGFDSVPTFRAEISPPPPEKQSGHNSRSITPPKKSNSSASTLEHVQPLPPPSANAFRRGHSKKLSALSLSNTGNASEGPKTASNAIFGSARPAMTPGPATGTFGPGASRAGAPLRQPRGPPPLEELVALPTSNHEGSKNFATRRRRAAVSNLVRAGSVRRGASYSSADSPTSDGDLSLHSSEADEPHYYRKQSPIGSERSAKRGSQSSVEMGGGSTVQTPATENGDAFDMSSFVKQLPPHVQQGQERRKMMWGVLNAAEKRKSFQF